MVARGRPWLAEMETLPGVPSSGMALGPAVCPQGCDGASLHDSITTQTLLSVSAAVSLASITCMPSEPPAGEGTLCLLHLGGG